jgi:hypothetical protein
MRSYQGAKHRGRVVNGEGARRVAVPTAANLLNAPERALELPPADAAAILAKVEGLAAVLRIAATSGSARNDARGAGDGILTANRPSLAPSALSKDASIESSPTSSPRDPANERWLTAVEVAAQVRRTRAWVYRQAKSWSFVTRPSRKTLLISEHGLNRWLERH